MNNIDNGKKHRGNPGNNKYLLWDDLSIDIQEEIIQQYILGKSMCVLQKEYNVSSSSLWYRLSKRITLRSISESCKNKPKRVLSEIHKQRVAAAKRGKPRSQETKDKISKKLKGRKVWNDGKELDKEQYPNMGKHTLTEEKKKEMSENKKLFYESDKGKEAKRKMSKTRKEKLDSGEIKVWNAGKTGVYSQETLMIMSKNRSGKPTHNKGKHPTKEQLKNWLRSTCAKPNKTELRIYDLLKKWLYGKSNYLLNTKGEHLVLGGKIPDFVDLEHMRIIELFGDFWHSEKITGKPKDIHAQERIDYFRQFGYETLIIWEYELQDLSSLQSKILEFTI